MVESSANITTSATQSTDHEQQEQKGSATTLAMTEDDGFQNNPPTEITSSTSMAESTANLPTVSIETTITATVTVSTETAQTSTSEAVATTTESLEKTEQPAPTEPIATEVTPTAPITTLYVESVYSSSTTAVPEIVSHSSDTSAGSSENIVATPSTTHTSTTSCIPSNQSSTCATASMGSNIISSGQIAGIAIGGIAFILLLGACLFITLKRTHNANNYQNQPGKKVSPFSIAGDQEKQSYNSNENNSRAVLYQSPPPESPTPERNESVYGDSMFYINSTDYCPTGSIMNGSITVSKHGYPPKLKDNGLSTPTTSLYPHTIKRHDSYSSSETTTVINSGAEPYYATATSAQLHQKLPINKQQQQQQQRYQQNASSTAETDTDHYTLSAMHVLRDSRQTISTTRTRSMVSSSIMSDNRKIYRPSLNNSFMFLHSPSSSIDNVNNRNSVTSPPPSSLRFSHHRRQESSLDPHILSSIQREMPLWDDHL